MVARFFSIDRGIEGWDYIVLGSELIMMILNLEKCLIICTGYKNVFDKYRGFVQY